jgi:hypothetical protein
VAVARVASGSGGAIVEDDPEAAIPVEEPGLDGASTTVPREVDLGLKG